MIATRGSAIRLLRGVALGATGLALAACSTTTYGTGVGPTAQTVQDLANIVDFGPGDPVFYCVRPGLENQPTPGAPLPPPPPPGTEIPPCPEPER
ncbi:MAG: hypothetical protein AB7O56_03565 [Bauldia sp.]